MKNDILPVIDSIYAAGLDAPAIANRLGISKYGVKFHLKNISTKTGTKSQVELVLKLARSFSQVVR